MKTKKMSLANIQGKLSRAEMKQIMAGSGGESCNTYWCSTNSDCVTKNCGNRCSSFQGNNRCWWNPF